MPTPKKPSVLKRLHGTDRADRMSKNEPKPEIELPDMPTHLGRDARIEWKRTGPTLVAQGLISQRDMAAFSMYCTAWGDYVKAERMKKRSGHTIITPNGSEQISPWVSISKHSMLIAHKFAIEFGFTPASRTRVSAPGPAKKKKPTDRFFK
jgi:P27 family predicted phage terminase small subunit